MAAAPQSLTQPSVRVLVWGENRHEHRDQRVAELYPHGMHTTITDRPERKAPTLERHAVGAFSV